MPSGNCGTRVRSPGAAVPAAVGALKSIRRLLRLLVEANQHCRGRAVKSEPQPASQKAAQSSSAFRSSVGARTLRKSINHTGPLEVPPELLLLGVGALRRTSGRGLRAAPPGPWAGGRGLTWKAAELSSEAAMVGAAALQNGRAGNT